MNEQFIYTKGEIMQNERIKAIYDAAVKLFLQQGYSKTQISHIAKAVGVSVGTIYHDFIGKQEIMNFILKCTIEPSFLEKDFERPITDKLFIGLNDEINNEFITAAEKFSYNIKNAGDGYTFENFIADAYDLLERYAIGCLFIEKNKMDCPELAEHYLLYRKKFISTMTEYVTKFMQKGIIRQLKHPELTTILIIETLSWWTMDMRYTSFETLDIPAQLAKDVCLDNIISAYKI